MQAAIDRQNQVILELRATVQELQHQGTQIHTELRGEVHQTLAAQSEEIKNNVSQQLRQAVPPLEWLNRLAPCPAEPEALTHRLTTLEKRPPVGQQAQ